ncbi:hypothetical protein NLJ89_g11059 [Agrocybe chaxingu]|uniref:Hydrophobin n=1 Tax=Agrocybe chaxingu TaxID=84603 RepID=A0A9W8JPG6_9AGAR|nr:hypothetical protein NLJ89_g11059 [Agrocybe chaxingu]
MFPNVGLLITAAVATSVVAIDSSCNTGPIQCCNAIATPSSATATNALSLVDVAVSDVHALVGVECTPITVIGAGSGASCSTTPVCCEKTFDTQLSLYQVVGINCSPITI